ncbi:undecaprenyl-phosphate glucose phosphotransferase [Devosia sp.]|uniref:undecaprenyl-phosphate glucose phosphotransferase n=1 Tax=Devosia sp. TaxID=1871048 RepID=UPI002F1862A6
MFRLDPKPATPDRVATPAAAPQQPAGLSVAAREVIARPAEPTYSAAVISGLVQMAEAVLLAGLGLSIHALYVAGDERPFYLFVTLATVAVANIMQHGARTHRIAAYRTLARQLLRVLAAWSLTFTLLAVGLVLFKSADLVSRVWLVSWYAAGALLLVAFRLVLRSLIRHWTRDGRLKLRTVVVGGGPDARMLIEAIRNTAENDINLLGLFDDRLDERSPAEVAGLKKLGRVSELAEFARRTRVDLVIVSMPVSAEARVLDMLKQLWVLPVDIRLSAHMSKLRFTRRAYSHVGSVPVFDVLDRPITDWNLVFKWVFDKAVAILALGLLWPVMLATALAIKLDSKGPVLFRQKRQGFNNEIIEVFKFRSMYADQQDLTASRLVTKGDPRVTRVGRFIRSTSIDELPQLFNVLRGDLSIVGPRPHALEAKAANQLYYEAVEGYFARHRVKPGITGWAQIHGWRGETDTVDKILNRVHADLHYIENWSLLLDVYIILMTPISLLVRRENAF